MADNFLTAKVISPDKTIFSGHVEAVSSVNKRGKFDVLTEHSNFISLIYDHVTLHRTGLKPQRITIDNAVMHVKANTVTVFIGFKQ